MDPRIASASCDARGIPVSCPWVLELLIGSERKLPPHLISNLKLPHPQTTFSTLSSSSTWQGLRVGALLAVRDLAQLGRPCWSFLFCALLVWTRCVCVSPPRVLCSTSRALVGAGAGKSVAGVTVRPLVTIESADLPISPTFVVGGGIPRAL